MYRLYIVQIIAGGIPLLYIFLIPTWKQVDVVVQRLKDQVHQTNKEIKTRTSIVITGRESIKVFAS